MGKVAIVGVEGSGKTVLMGALCECYKQISDDAPFLMPENQAAYMFMERIPHKLRVQREWPEATNVSSLKSMRWTLRCGQEVMEEIEMLDYPGELYRLAFGEHTKEEADAHRAELNEFLEHLTGADFLVVLLNIADLESPGANSRNAETIWITRGIFDFAKKLPNIKRTMLVFTQADRYAEELAAAGGAQALYAARLPMLKCLYPDLKAIVVSAVSGTDGEGRPKAGYSAEGCLEVMREILAEADAEVQRCLGECKRLVELIEGFQKGGVDEFVSTVKSYANSVQILVKTARPLKQVYSVELAWFQQKEVNFSELVIHLSSVVDGAGIDVLAESNTWSELIDEHKGFSFIFVGLREFYAEKAKMRESERLAKIELNLKKRKQIQTVCAIAGLFVLSVIAIALVAGRYEEKKQLTCLASESGLSFTECKRAWEDDSGDACFMIGDALDKTNMCNTSLKWYRKAAVQGHARAQKKVGSCYYNGKGVTQDRAEAVKWFRKAADKGYADAQCSLGACYYRGESVAQDKAEAVTWYRKAAEQENAIAQYNLGRCYYDGEGVAQDKVEAVKWFRKAADKGYAYAQLYLGACYSRGDGVAQDETEAVKWFRKAAEQGQEIAQYNLGLYYEKGEGVKQDFTEAVKWYRKAAEQGNAGAQGNLGACYSVGAGVAQDETEAVKWFLKAAEQGNADAQLVLGTRYYTGKGVAQDKAEAVKWFRKAAEQGSAHARRVLDILAR